MKDAVKHHGVKLIVADPRRVEMVNFAALWLCQKPGTDVPLFSAMANVILAENLYNKKFVEERTENLDAFAKSMRDFTPEYAERVSGVPRDDIVKAARMYASAKRATIYWALGIPEHTHGTENAMSLIHLALLTGHIGKEGTGLNPLRGQNNVQGASDAGAMPWDYPGYQKADDPAVVEKFRAAWGHTPPAKRGLTTTEIANGWESGAIKSMYVMGENPLMSEPNLRHAHHAIENLEFLVCQDLFINETGRYADVILPGASWAEKDGTFTNTDRRVQRVRKAFEPFGEARADWANRVRCGDAVGEKIRSRKIGGVGLRASVGNYGRRWGGLSQRTLASRMSDWTATVCNGPCRIASILGRRFCLRAHSRAAKRNFTRSSTHRAKNDPTPSIRSFSRPGACCIIGTAARKRATRFSISRNPKRWSKSIQRTRR